MDRHGVAHVHLIEIDIDAGIFEGDAIAVSGQVDGRSVLEPVRVDRIAGVAVDKVRPAIGDVERAGAAEVDRALAVAASRYVNEVA